MIIISAFLPRPFWIIGIILIFIWVVISNFAKRSKFGKIASISVFTISVFTILHLWSHSVTDTWNYSKNDVIIFAVLAVLFLIALQTKSSKPLNIGNRSLLGISIFVTLIAVLQFYGILGLTQFSASDIYFSVPIHRVTGLLPHATSFAISIFLLFLVSRFSLQRDLRYYSAIGMLLLTALACTQVRSLFFLALTYEIVVNYKLLLQWINIKRLTVGAAIIIMIGTALYFTDSIPRRYKVIFSAQGGHSQRVLENRIAWSILKRNPLGLGTGNLAESYRLAVQAAEIPDVPKYAHDWRGIHNMFLHVGVLWGFPALLLLALGFALSVAAQPSWPYKLGIIAFGIYGLSEMPFYFENLPLELAFMGHIFASCRPKSERPLSSRISLALTLLLAIFSLPVLLQFRRLQIRSTPAVSVLVNNDGTSSIVLKVDSEKEFEIPAGTYHSFHLIEGKHRFRLGTESPREWSAQLVRRNREIHREYFILNATSEKQRFDLIDFNNSAGKMIKLTESFTVDPGIQFVAVPEKFARSGNEVMETIPEIVGNQISSVPLPILQASPIPLLTKYNCYEPLYRQTYDPCQILNTNAYSIKGVIKNLFHM